MPLWHQPEFYQQLSGVIKVEMLTCDLHCSTATPDVARQMQRFLTVHAAVTPTSVLPAPVKGMSNWSNTEFKLHVQSMETIWCYSTKQAPTGGKAGLQSMDIYWKENLISNTIPIAAKYENSVQDQSQVSQWKVLIMVYMQVKFERVIINSASKIKWT